VIAVQPAGTATVGFLSAVKEATSTSPAVRPSGAGNETVVVVVSVDAVLKLRMAIPETGGAGLTVMVVVLDVEPAELVAVSFAV
jgi:hypothetical protein